MHRRNALMGVCAWLVACAENKPPGYYAPPPLQPLQDPLPGHAVLYLFRAPHDRSTLLIRIRSKTDFLLEPSTYTVLSLRPGDYTITSGDASKAAFAPAPLRLQEGERAFMYVSGSNEDSLSLENIAALLDRDRDRPFSGIVPAVAPGSRSWKVCSEVDAQGFMSVSKLKIVD